MEPIDSDNLAREKRATARLVAYVAAAPGAGKTRRLLSDGVRLQSAGKRVAIGWIETKDRLEVERLAQGFARIPPRITNVDGRTVTEFDVDAAIAAKPDVVLLDELAHDNASGSRNDKRWQDALALRAAGITVLVAFDIEHLETVSPRAESLLGHPVRETVPLSFLKSADEVIALDASPELLRRRLPAGNTQENALVTLRQLLLRTIDNLTMPMLSAANASTAVAILPASVDPRMFLARSVPLAAAFDLALEIIPGVDADAAKIALGAGDHDAEVLPAQDLDRIDVTQLRASALAVPNGKFAKKLVNQPVDRDIFVVDAAQSYLEAATLSTPLSGTLGDRLRVGYGKLTVYLGAATGAGKTYAMLDRGQQLLADGVDVTIGLVETHQRPETQAMIGNLPIVPRKQIVSGDITYAEMDRETILARKPRVVLVDELAHTNAPGSLASKRYLDVLAFLRAGIDVLTTLNVHHIEALSDVVRRLTGATMRETLPDGILPLADELILVDVTPETLRERMREGKIFPRERIDEALAHFFRTENLASLRELAIREALRAERRTRIAAPFGHLLLSIVGRPEDMLLVRKASRLAARLQVDFSIAHVAEPRDKIDAKSVADFELAARTLNAEWLDARADDAATRVLEVARKRAETVVAVGGTHRAARWPARNSFARRLLDAGARELIVLARPLPEAAGTIDEH
ncbi:MAG TPA: hypothetical protein VNF68_03840 [Candidatus Baltobacteraceae bacterium]|nr:hypothetical protein [Candidatus Baltobacteraceae bacterium]